MPSLPVPPVVLPPAEGVNVTPTKGIAGVAVSAPNGVKLGVMVGSAIAVAVSSIAFTSITGSGGSVASPDAADVFVAALALPTSVGVTIERGGVGVTVPPPNTAVGSSVPCASAVRSGGGVAVGKPVGMGFKRTNSAAIQPSRPSSIRMLNHLPSGLVASTCTPVPGVSATMAFELTLGPWRTFTVCSDVMIPVCTGVALAVGVLLGVGEIGVSEGVKVKVGSGVRDGTGVAVNRGVRVTNGASVSVGIPALCSTGVLVVHAATNSRARLATIKVNRELKL